MPNEPAEPLEPGTKLPWYQFDEFTILSRVPVDAGMDGKVADLDYSEFPPEVARQDAAYIVEACNNYPRLQAVYNAVTEYRRKERALLKLPDEAREEDHLEAIRHIVFQHKEMNQAYGVLSSNTKYWKEETAALRSKLSALEEPCVWTWDQKRLRYIPGCCNHEPIVCSGPVRPENKFCCFCGHKIQESISEHREET